MDKTGKPLIVSGITVIFLILAAYLMLSSSAASLLLTVAFTALVIVFFTVLDACALVLAFVMLADRIHFYAVQREKRELERQVRRQQAESYRYRGHEGRYSYTPRHLYIMSRPPEDTHSNGC